MSDNQPHVVSSVLRLRNFHLVDIALSLQLSHQIWVLRLVDGKDEGMIDIKNYIELRLGCKLGKSAQVEISRVLEVLSELQ